MIAKPLTRKHIKGQSDHVDAWLMSYADLITLLFMLFVIFVSVTMSKHGQHPGAAQGEPPHPQVQERSGTLSLHTDYDNIYRELVGIVGSGNADQYIAVEKTTRGLWIDISAVQFFASGSADVPEEALPLLQSIARALNRDALANARIEVAGYTDDEKLLNSKFANNWELATMRATRIVSLLADAGIAPSRLHAASYAANDPIVPNRDALGNPIIQNRLRNQRVLIKVESPEETVKAVSGLK